MERRLAAILSIDVVGYSRLMEVDEARTFASLNFLRTNVIDPAMQKYSGRLVKLIGDGALMEFASVVQAVSCAIEIQNEIANRNREVAEQERLDFRIGINLGDVIVEADDLYGDGVNVAARVEGLAPAGGICITRPVRDQVRDKLRLDLEDLGEVEVKNLARPVRVFLVAGRNRSSAKLPSKSNWRRRSKIFPATAGAVIVLATLLGMTFYLRETLGPDNGAVVALPEGKPSLVVLPFKDLSEANGQEYFVDGLTDDLIIDLSKLSGLFVISRSTAFTYKGQAVRAKEVTEDLGVRYLLEGSVRRSGDRVRVNAQLVEGSTGTPLWTERFERRVEDLFTLQDDLTAEIVEALEVTLTASEETHLSHERPTSLEAYELYLKARDYYYSQDQEKLQESLKLYAQAWELDPDFARAYAGYAQIAADVWRLSSLRSALSGASSRRAAEAAAKKALSLDPTIPEAYSVLALLKMADGEYEEALSLSRQALENDPNGAETYTDFAIVLIYAGEEAAALEAMRTAIRLSPKPTPYQSNIYGLALFMNERYREAIVVLEPIADTPGRGIADAPREILAMAYAEAGQIKDAREQVRDLLAAEPYLNVSYYRVRYSHHADPAMLELRINALSKSGMPKWPFDFDEDGKQRLDAEEIKAMISATTWKGLDQGRGKFIQEFSSGNGTVYAGATTIFNGKAFTREDQLCEEFEGFMLGREVCGPIFRLPIGPESEPYRFVYVNSTTVKEFDLAN